MSIFRGSKKFGFVAIVFASSVALMGSAGGLSDVTPPSVNIAVPGNGASYGQNVQVLASYTCSDASGIAACVGTASNGSPIPTQSLGTKSFTVSGYDYAGNKTKVTRTYTVVDQTKPVISLSSPTQGATYAKNSFVVARFTCYDTGVGIAAVNGCVGTVSNGSTLNTSTSGGKSFTVNAKDAAGNAQTKTVSYTVSP